MAGKEENVKEQIEELEKHFPVWISDISNLDEAYEMIEQVGFITNKEQPAKELIFRIKENFARNVVVKPLDADGLTTKDADAYGQHPDINRRDSRLKTAYFIWQNPYMAAGGDTFIHSMMTAAGLENIFADKKRYPGVTIADLQIASCQLLLLSSEPFPFSEKHIEEIRAKGFKGQILLVDGEMFGWYGSRMLRAPFYFKEFYKQIR
jgi:ABC-type Fe3+-hydroxamate transport system substrate-binding protein